MYDLTSWSLVAGRYSRQRVPTEEGESFYKNEDGLVLARHENRGYSINNDEGFALNVRYVDPKTKMTAVKSLNRRFKNVGFCKRQNLEECKIKDVSKWSTDRITKYGTLSGTDFLNSNVNVNFCPGITSKSSREH